MERYRAAWLRVAGCITMLGLCAAVVVFPLSAITLTFAVAALIGSTSAWSWAGCRDVRLLARVGFATGSAALATGALTVWLGPGGVLVPVLLLLSAPPLVSRLSRLLAYHWEAPTGSPNPTGGSASRSELASVTKWSAERTLAREDWMTNSPAGMDSAALCLAWRRSYLAMGKPLSLASRSLIVKRRQELLDELERRNPSGFAAWLDSGARAAGDPGRYILSRGGEEPHR